MSKNGRITIKEIAQQAGVSKQTVSRVLNNRPDVSSKTRKRIQTIIERSSYQPSKVARSLTRGRTNIIGVITSDLRHVGPSHMLVGIDEQAYASGYTISLGLIHDQDDDEAIDNILQGMVAEQVAGLLWTAVSKLDNYQEVIEKLINLPIPVVVGAELKPEKLSAVYTDSCIGAAHATQHLIDQGYQNIGIITGPLGEWSARLRLTGWEETNPSPDSSLIYEGDWTAASGYKAFHQLLRQRPDMDAVFASNDQMALGVLKAAYDSGLKVPHTLGVVGFDDIPEAMYFTPSLTTVRQNLLENGRLLVQKLDRQIQAQSRDEPSEPQILQTPPELVIRASSVRNE